MERQKSSLDKRTILWLFILLGAACLFLFHGFILGNDVFVFSDTGSDMKDQYIMQYNSIVNHLRAGDLSLWDFSNGLGSNAFVMPLFNPFLWLVYLAGVLFGPAVVSRCMIFYLIAEIILAGFFCYLFLSEFPFEERAKLPACFMYALNGYLMVWGQHYQLGTVVVYLPLLFRYIERIRSDRRNFFKVAAVSALLIFNGFYQGYMCMLGVGIYVCFRILLYDTAPWISRWKSFAYTAAGMALGVLLGAVNLLPSAAAQIIGTDRLEASESLLERIWQNLALWPGEYYSMALYRLFGSNTQGTANVYSGYANYYEALNLFFSTLFVILLVQYLCSIHRQKKTGMQKAAQYLGVLLVAGILTVRLGSLAFNGFAYVFSRYTFLLMPLFALLSAAALERILGERRLNLPALFLALAAIVAVYAGSYSHIGLINEKDNALLLCITGVAMVCVLYCYVRVDRADKNLCYGILLLLLFVNMVSDGALCVRNREGVRQDDSEYYEDTYHSSVQDALAWIREQDPSFYRVEKDFYTASEYLDSMAQDYMGISTYNSTQNKYIRQFVEKLWPQLTIGNDSLHYKFANSLADSVMAGLTDVKYLLSRREDLRISGYEQIAQTGDVYIYRNTGTDSVGKFFRQTMTEEEFESCADADPWKLLQEVLIVEEGQSAYPVPEEALGAYRKETADLLDAEQMQNSRELLSEDGLAMDGVRILELPIKTEELERYDAVSLEFCLEMEEGTGVIVQALDGTDQAASAEAAIDLITKEGYCHVRYQYPGQYVYRSELPEGTEKVLVRILDKDRKVRISSLKFYVERERTGFSAGAQIEMDSPDGSGELHGEIRAKEDGMVMLAIPADEGWTLRLNGEEQPFVRGDYGFVAFPVEAGEYQIELTYLPPLLREGAAISLASFLLLVLLWLCSHKRSAVRREKK